MSLKLSAAFVGLLAIAACSPKMPGEDAASMSVIAESAAASVTSAEAASMEQSASQDNLAGRWQGPEGTSLTLTRVDSAWQITIVDLDGPRDFTGESVSDGIRFTRDGQVHTIRKGTGDATGMKWLAGKKDCLVVMTGEGYCHD